MKNITRRSRHFGYVFAVAVVVVSAACGSDPVEPEPEYPMTMDVFTPGAIFSPPIAEIAKGGTIRFLITEAPDGDGHNAIFNRTTEGAPINVPIVKDTTVSRTFTVAGTFSYFCTVHPGMAGEVIVH